ncbi:MAG: hypothetical protein H6682_08390 [Candidatus Eisenbacteria bacterium]|nr:hypothetical protein [Candidatus Eisenbacteria bacterium]
MLYVPAPRLRFHTPGIKPRRLFATCFAPVLLVTAFAGSGLAQFTSGAQSQDITPNARAQGMGRAFTAIAEGPNATWWNPGSLALQTSISMSPWSSADLVPEFADVQFNSYGIVGARKGTGFSFHLSNLDYGSSDFGDSSEYTLLLGGGLDLVSLTGHRPGPLSVGVGMNLKRFSVDLKPDWAAPERVGESGSGWDFDLGALVGYEVPLDLGESEWAGDSSLRFRGGAVLKNFLDSTIDYDEQNESDPLLRRTCLGLAIDGTFGRLEPLGPIVQAVASIDHISSSLGRRDIQHWGGELTLLNMVSLRRGHIEDKDGAITDSTEGYGVGFSFPFRGGSVRSVRFQYDHAEVPQATGLSHVLHDSIALSVELR